MSSFGEHIGHQKGIFESIIIKIIKSAKPNILPNKDEKTIHWIISFKDDSKLEAWETLSIKNNQTEMIRYGYEYTSLSGFCFSYELDKEGSTKIEKLKKPQHHLHVGIKKERAPQNEEFPEQLVEHGGPHYKVPPISIDEIVGMIILNFFPNNTDLLGDRYIICWCNYGNCMKSNIDSEFIPIDSMIF
jgi:hypothetical protein